MLAKREPAKGPSLCEACARADIWSPPRAGGVKRICTTIRGMLSKKRPTQFGGRIRVRKGRRRDYRLKQLFASRDEPGVPVRTEESYHFLMPCKAGTLPKWNNAVKTTSPNHINNIML